MDIAELKCVNHPTASTRVRCSSCERPICVHCMRESAVGMKCPDCSRTPVRVRWGSPRQWIVAVGGGLLTAMVSGVLLSIFSLLFFLGPMLAGLAVGEVVARTSGRRGQREFRLIAVAVTVVGLCVGRLIIGGHVGGLIEPGWLIALGIASFTSALRAS